MTAAFGPRRAARSSALTLVTVVQQPLSNQSAPTGTLVKSIIMTSAPNGCFEITNATGASTLNNATPYRYSRNRYTLFKGIYNQCDDKWITLPGTVLEYQAWNITTCPEPMLSAIQTTEAAKCEAISGSWFREWKAISTNDWLRFQSSSVW